MLTCIVSYDIAFLQLCYDNFDSDMKCLAPRLSNKNGTSQVVIGLQMDNVRNLLILEDVNITVFTDPIFNTGLSFEIQPGQSQNLTLTVSACCDVWTLFNAAGLLSFLFQGEGFHFSLAQIKIMVQDVSTDCVPKRITDVRTQITIICSALVLLLLFVLCCLLKIIILSLKI